MPAESAPAENKACLVAKMGNGQLYTTCQSVWRAVMGLIDRILRVIRANINNLIGQAEDPERFWNRPSQICRMI